MRIVRRFYLAGIFILAFISVGLLIYKISLGRWIPDLETLVEKGMALSNTENYKKAIKVCQEIIKYYPNTERALMARKRIPYYYYKLKEYDKAIEKYHELMANPPYERSRFDALWWIVECYREQKKYELAINECKNFIKNIQMINTFKKHISC